MSSSYAFPSLSILFVSIGIVKIAGLVTERHIYGAAVLEKQDTVLIL